MHIHVLLIIFCCNTKPSKKMSYLCDGTFLFKSYLYQLVYHAP